MAADEEVVDHLSALPDEVVLHILSLLPPVYSTLLSFVSARFRRLWMSTPDLELSESHHDPLNPRCPFQNIVRYALNNHEKLGIIRRFHLSCFDRELKESKIGDWIDLSTIGSCSNLEEFCFALTVWYRIDLTQSISSCRKLKTLRLIGSITLEEIPGDVHVLFPNLRALSLEFISIEKGKTLRRLLSCCPRLQTLEMRDCSINSKELDWSGEPGCTIEIESLDIEYEVKPSDAIASARIDVAWSSGDAFDFLNSFSNILHELEIYNPQRISWFDDEAIVFPKLTHLVVKSIEEPYDQYDNGTLSRFLEASPNLISLVLYKYKVEEYELGNVVLPKLEEIRFLDFRSEEKEGVKYFLRNASWLKKLVIWPYLRSDLEQVEAEILDEPRASRHCQILFTLC